jgi:predicted ATP-binding protein involved in virulence
MKLRQVQMKNFRGLKSILFKTESPATVIVGPNGMGKTSILEAIRLVKGILMPSYEGENSEIFQSLGVISPHHPQMLNLRSILGDFQQDLQIGLTLELNDAEVSLLEKNLPRLALVHLRSINALPPGLNELSLTQYLSSEEGNRGLAHATSEIQNELKKLSTSKLINPTLVISNGIIRGLNIFDQEFVSLISGSLMPDVGLFSYFPADRALPSGEVAIQIGGAEAAQQIRAHIGQPMTKYSRLKQFIVNKYLTGAEALNELNEDFNLIFTKLLPGKKLEGLSVAQNGVFSVAIREIYNGAVYDIDSISSGEKGLILTFFLMKRCVTQGGIVLVDEPELHLNSAVCKKILPFLVEEVLNPSDIQAIICTHSPEVLATAFDREDCTLFHLRTPEDISPILPQDKLEVFDALKHLGNQASDVLFWKGGIFVEGPNDVDLLEAGFSDKIAGYKITKLGGRDEVEKEIKVLQIAEKQGKLDSVQFFIFDLDRKPTNLVSSEKVKVIQWDRYCLENYLLDDAIYDACSSIKMANKPESRGSILPTLRKLAFNQIRGVVAKKVGLRPQEIDCKESYELIANVLVERLLKIRAQLDKLNEENWCTEFTKSCENSAKSEIEDWEQRWHIRCDGKRVISDFYKKCERRCSITEFKKTIITEMKKRKTENWRLIESIIEHALKETEA